MVEKTLVRGEQEPIDLRLPRLTILRGRRFLCIAPSVPNSYCCNETISKTAQSWWLDHVRLMFRRTPPLVRPFPDDRRCAWEAKMM